ncbi:hypothetical protein N7G274_005704 [Stereocaulon virgatum]|uniref:Uncharacterized protein n=1 Tax=Stereocaulon virgatum TaxID=373712 RepID=A0ABR4A5Y4_9LECA
MFGVIISRWHFDNTAVSVGHVAGKRNTGNANVKPPFASTNPCPSLCFFFLAYCQSLELNVTCPYQAVEIFKQKPSIESRRIKSFQVLDDWLAVVNRSLRRVVWHIIGSEYQSQAEWQMDMIDKIRAACHFGPLMMNVVLSIYLKAEVH